ncbi:hypothetical protein ACU62C_02535 [Klebsiella aerogenes]
MTMTDSHMNLKVLNTGISSLLKCIILTDIEAPADNILHRYQPHLRTIIRALKAFEATYRDALPEEVCDTAECEKRQDAQTAEHEALIHAQVKPYRVPPLADSDCPEGTMNLLRCNNSLMEFIYWLSTHTDEEMEPYLPVLRALACEIAKVLEIFVMNVLNDAGKEPMERMTGQELAAYTGRLAGYSIALITCASELRKYEKSEFDYWSDDLLLFAREVAYAFSACARTALPLEPGYR